VTDSCRILLYGNPNSTAPRWPPLRQTFLGQGFVLGKRFRYVVGDDNNVDYLFACADGEPLAFGHQVPREKRVVVLMENPSIWMPSAEYLSQFGMVVSPSMIPLPQGTRLYLSQPGVGWFYGMRFRTDLGLAHVPILEDYMQLDDLAALSMPPKTRLISCIASQKGGTSGHNWRIEVAIALKEYFGDQIDMFGFGWNPIADKRIALDNYLHTVVVENEGREHYWTEKLADATLGYCNPIYSGAPNVSEYFSNISGSTIRFGIPSGEFVKAVKNIIDAPVNAIELHERRHLTMYKYNIF